MIKDFNDMMAIDVSAYTDKRDEFPYLNWAVCKKLLHENGASKVVFWPIRNKDGSSLFHTERVYGDGDKTNQCYEVGVHVIIDDLDFDFWGPLMNGTNPVKDNSISQQRIWNCQTRLFVKGVAMFTGLGFSLWLKEEQEGEKRQKSDDLDMHDVRKIKTRLEQAVTSALDAGYSMEEIAKGTEVGSEREDVVAIIRSCTKIYNFEGLLKGMIAKKHD